MIDKTLTFLLNALNDYFETSDEPKVVLSNIVAQDGSADHLPGNSILLTLVNVEEEKVLKSQTPYIKESNGSISKINPEIKINLSVLFSANFSHKNYDQALKYLSGILRFFQARNVFDHQNSPTLDPEIDKLILELITPSFEQLNHMWGFLGAKYMPSVMYKVRMLTIQESKVIESVEGVAGINKEFSGS